MCSICYPPAAPGTVTTNTANPIARRCGFLACQNVITPDFPWSMCDACYLDAD